MSRSRVLAILAVIALLFGAVNLAAQSTYKIGYLPSTLGQAATKAWGVGIDNALKAAGNIPLQSLDAMMKAETQVSMMDDFINQGYDFIIIQPIDAAALTASVKKAESKGIPVITLNTDTLAPHFACVSMDDYGAGYKVGEAMGKQIGGKGNVALIQSPPGAIAGVDREKGFRAAMAKLYPNIKIVGAQNGEWNKDKAIALMNSFLQANKQLDGVFAVNDNMAEGAAIAADSSGRLKDVKIWGFNGQMSTLTQIEQGKIAGTAYTNAYEQGATAARMALDVLRAGTKSFAKTQIVTIPPFMATADNVAQIPANIRW
ncbi:MAG: sugar ABC transporter substrate-binding protein [Spirochaetota bacterium]